MLIILIISSNLYNFALNIEISSEMENFLREEKFKHKKNTPTHEHIVSVFY